MDYKSDICFVTPFFFLWADGLMKMKNSKHVVICDDAVFYKTDLRSKIHALSFEVPEHIFDPEIYRLVMPVNFGDEWNVKDLTIKPQKGLLNTHLKSIRLFYEPHSKHWNKDFFENVIEAAYKERYNYLLDLNMDLIYGVCRYLDIDTDKFVFAGDHFKEYQNDVSLRETYFTQLLNAKSIGVNGNEGKENSLRKDVYKYPIKNSNFMDIIFNYSKEEILENFKG